MLVTCNVEGRDVSSVVQEIQSRLGSKELALPAGDGPAGAVGRRVGRVQQLWPDQGTVDQPKLIDLYAPPPQPSLRVNFVASLDGAGTLDGRSAGLSVFETM